ncbi:MAG: hypothetical protein ACREF6_15800, partial [Alphaproteobacteria bacterium]
QERRHPDRSARVLLTVISYSPEVVEEALKASISTSPKTAARTANKRRRAERIAPSKMNARKVRA